MKKTIREIQEIMKRKSVNIQSSRSNYTVKGLQRRIAHLFKDNHIDEAQRVSSLIVEAWLENLAPMNQANWDAFVDEHQDWHIRVRRSTRHSRAYRGAVTVSRADELSGTHYRDMFVTIALEHSKAINTVKVATEKVLDEITTSEFPTRVMKHTQVRGTHFYDDRAENVKALDEEELRALAPDEVAEIERENILKSASVVELLGAGNFRIRG